VDATARFVELVRGPEADVPLDEAAFLIAAHASPDLDVGARLSELDALAADVPEPDAGSLARFLFVERGFAGNEVDYGDPRNSFLDAVLDRRLGIPITLSVLMIEVGRRRGLVLTGVGMPGHFLVGAGPGEWYDPFHGGASLDLAGCEALFAGAHGPVPFRPEYLAPVGPRAILSRILANLQRSFLRRDPASAAWAVRLRLQVPGLTPRERGEQAGLLGSLGAFGEAAAELDALAGELSGEGAERAKQAATRLRARAN